MRISTKIFRGLTMFFAMLLVLSIAMASIMEYYRSSLDENTDALSSQVVVDSDSGEWSYGTQFTSVADAVAGLKDFAIREAAESFVLLKNEDSALPLTGSKPKVTLFGLRSYAAYYGSTGGGSIPDKATVDLATPPRRHSKPRSTSTPKCWRRTRHTATPSPGAARASAHRRPSGAKRSAAPIPWS